MRSSTQKIYQQKTNEVIDYISSHLHKSLNLDALASQIGVSQRQLLRIMEAFLNESLSAYIARQRMECAVMYMQTNETNLTTLAGMVGYDNPQSFSKAFKKQFGISPKFYLNKLQIQLKNNANSYTCKQNNLHSYVCEEKDTELVYIRITGKYGESEPYNTGWNKLVAFLKVNKALTKSTRFVGISFDNPNVTKSNPCRFYACASVPKGIVPTGEFGVIELRQGRYAVYTLKGSYSGLQDLYNQIAIHCEYELRHGLSFEEYVNSPHNTPEDDLITKIYIPIK